MRPIHSLKFDTSKKFLILGFALVLFGVGVFAPPLARAATYYIANAGNNSNNGTSNSTPWQTIAKVNSSTFLAGDSILFNKGDTWREQLNVPSSGNASNTITFGAYGSGAQPIISAANVVASSTWTQVNGSVAQTNIKLSVVNGTAFVDFGVANALTSYLGDKITITDHAGKTLVGYISAAGSGETYGSENLSNTTFSNTTGIQNSGGGVTVTSVASSSEPSGYYLKVTGVSSFSSASEATTLLNGALYRASLYQIAGTSNGYWDLALGGSPYTAWTPASGYNGPATWTQYVEYAAAASTSANLVFGGPSAGLYNLYGTASVKQVLTPSVTGVTIVSTAGGLTYNWTSEQSGFNQDDTSGYTYTISGAGGATYEAPLATQPYVVIQDGTRLMGVSSSSLLTAAGEWWYDPTGQNLYVWATDSANPNTHVIEAGARNNCIVLNGTSYVTINGLACSGFNSDGIIVEGGANYAIISGNTIKNGPNLFRANLWGAGIRVGGATPSGPGGATNATISSNDVSYTFAGIDVEGYGSPISSFATVSGNTVHYIDSGGINITGTGNGVGNLGNQPAGAVVSYNTIYHAMNAWDDGDGIGGFDVGTGTIFKYNTIYDNGAATGCTIENVAGPLTSPCRGAGIDVDSLSSPTQVYGNLIYDNTYGGINITASGHYIYNNTLYQNDQGTADAGEISTFTGDGLAASSDTIENNILVGSAGKHILQIQAGNTVGHMINHNDYYGGSATPFGWGGTDYNFANYEATSSQDSGSTNSNPLFVSTSTNNFTLTSSSPAIDAGVNLGSTYQLGLDPASTWPSNVITDNQNSFGAGWDIGAYVYTQISTPSVAMTAPTASSTVLGTISVTATSSAVSPASIASVQFYLDGSPLGSAVTSSPYAISWNTATATNASHTLYALATDNYSNTASSSVLTITVDNLPPSVSITSPTSGSTVSGNNMSVVASSTDTQSGIASVAFYLDGSLLSQSTSSPFAATWDTTQASNGAHNLSAIATDGVGNATTSAVVSVSVSNVTPPSPVVSAGGGGSTYSLAIDNGMAMTATPSVTLSLYGTGAYTMEVSNVSTFAGAAWIPYATAMPWTLAPNLGSQTVYVQFRSVNGTLVGTAQASINLVSAGSSSPISSSASSSSQSPASSSLVAELANLQSQLAALRAQANQQGVSPSTHFVFTRNLSLWNTGNDVKQLQLFLIYQTSGSAAAKLSAHGTTNLFGTLTFNALIEFQKKAGIKPASGYFGSLTRKYINAL